MAKNPRLKRATSSDVAHLAGVSRTTVSLVINNTPSAHISEETRARVHEAITRLDYHPHDAARNLRTQASRILGVAIPDANNPHYLQTFEGVEAYAKANGYSLFLSITNFDVKEEQRCFEWLKQQRSDALIIMSGTGRALLKEIHSLYAHGHYVTNMSFRDANLIGANIDSVVPEARRGEELLLKHLVELGHRRIGYIYGVANHEFLNDRLNICLEIQRELGVPVVDNWICRCGPRPEDGFMATRTLLASCRDDLRPSVLIVVNDLLATGVLAALTQEDVKVPAEMSVASFDNAPLAAFTSPTLTTVDYNARAMGENAARLTIQRLASPDSPSMYIEMPARLVVRSSTGPTPAM